MPPVSGGALVAAAPLHTPPRAIVHLPPTFWCSKASPEFWGLINYNAWNAFFFVHTALSRRVVAGIAWASVRAARDNDAFRDLGRWDRSSCVNSGRCHARRALVQGYDTRARDFTRSEGRLRAPGQKNRSARDGWFRILWKFLAGSSLEVTLALSAI